MEECIFCNIANSSVKSEKVYEDEHCFAFLDINPVAKGHTLVIPKKHYTSILDIPESELSKLAFVIKKVTAAVIKGTGAEGANIVQNNGAAAGQVINHIHFHIIPRKSGDNFKLFASKYTYHDGEMKKVAEAIRKSF
ncbi:MAG: HIT family protein [Candidatus Woesearchaeota archaeon]